MTGIPNLEIPLAPPGLHQGKKLYAAYVEEQQYNFGQLGNDPEYKFEATSAWSFWLLHHGKALLDRSTRPGDGWLLAILDIADELADGNYTGEHGAEALRLLVHEAHPEGFCKDGHTPTSCGCEAVDG